MGRVYLTLGELALAERSQEITVAVEDGERVLGPRLNTVDVAPTGPPTRRFSQSSTGFEPERGGA